MWVPSVGLVHVNTPDKFPPSVLCKVLSVQKENVPENLNVQEELSGHTCTPQQSHVQNHWMK